MLLLGIPGINVVSAAEFAGEMGPIERYVKARAITKRAGLYPSRYQSDEVDRPDGRLVRHANHDLRRAILMIAENLIRLNEHFGLLAAGWRLKDVDRSRHLRSGGGTVLPDRFSDGRRPNDLPAPVQPAPGLHAYKADEILN